MKQTIASIFRTQKVFIKDLEDSQKEYFYTTRKFLGKLTNFDSKSERSFEGKHLKAYLKGHKTFSYQKQVFNVMSGVVINKLDTKEVEAHLVKQNGTTI